MQAKSGPALALISFISLLAMPCAGAAAPKVTVVQKWGRFEKSFKSAFTYANPVQDARLRMEFVSPIGETNWVDGFWDGGKTWRVRFAPNLAGRWTYKSSCSDATNGGLHFQTGEFICSAATGDGRFQKHGPVRVARDHRHLEHADGTPFFWLADAVWNGARLSEAKEWETYARIRSSQMFSAAIWSAAPGVDGERETPYTGSERIVINPEFFKRLDARLEALNRAGILSGIVPLMELVTGSESGPVLPDDQVLLLVRYVVARWGAEPVAWMLAFEGNIESKKVARWKRVGQEVFGEAEHAPVVLFTGGTQWLLNEFRGEVWVDVLGYQGVTELADDALRYTFAGPFAQEWSRTPAKPVISFLPMENGKTPARTEVKDCKTQAVRFTADDIRKAAYWSLMVEPRAGVSYAGSGVAEWAGSLKIETRKQKAETELPLWQRALFMNGAKEMEKLARFMEANDFWKLEPRTKEIVSQPDGAAPARYMAAAETETKNWKVVYVPEDRTVEVLMEALPASPMVTWFNPRTGETSPAVAVVGARTCQFPTPDPGDWVLLMRSK